MAKRKGRGRAAHRQPTIGALIPPERLDKILTHFKPGDYLIVRGRKVIRGNLADLPSARR